MGEAEFLRIPNLTNLTYLHPARASPTSRPPNQFDGGSELPCQSDPRHPPLSSARCADHAGEVLPALDAHLCRREKWRRANYQGNVLSCSCPLPNLHPSHDRIDDDAHSHQLRPHPRPVHRIDLGIASGTHREANARILTALRVFLELRVDCRIAAPVEHRCRRLDRPRCRLYRLVLPSLWQR